jgi:hypothetical protein
MVVEFGMKIKLLIGLGIFILISFFFYWFQLRPSNIKEKCIQRSIDNNLKTGNIEGINTAYSWCLHQHGL